jgi:predicted PurR-regulated permease PerM
MDGPTVRGVPELLPKFLHPLKPLHPQQRLTPQTGEPIQGQLLNNKIKLRQKKFLIQSGSFSEMLEAAIRKYQNRAIEAAVFVTFVFFVVKDRDAFASPFAPLPGRDRNVAPTGGGRGVIPL